MQLQDEGELAAEFAASTTAGMIAKLDIASVGPTGAEKLVAKLDSLDKIIAADGIDLRQATAAKQAEAVREFFKDEANQKLARDIEAQLLAFGMHWSSEKKVAEGLPLAGQTQVLTGTTGAHEPRYCQGETGKSGGQGSGFGFRQDPLCGGGAGGGLQAGQGQ